MRINIHGGPGSGKSTLAAYLFHQLKCRHINAELVAEYVKAWAYERRPIKQFDQAYIFMKQLHSEEAFLRHGASHTITDAPLYLMAAYAKRDSAWMYEPLIVIAREFESRYPSLNLLLERPETYQVEGRFETADEAAVMDAIVESVLLENDVVFERIACADNDAACRLVLEAVNAK